VSDAASAESSAAPRQETGEGHRSLPGGSLDGVTNPYPQMEQYLFSRTLKASPDANVELVTGDAVARVRELKARPGKGIWLCGGGELAAALFGEIDEMVLKVNPVLLGAGIPLFARPVPTTAVELLDGKTYANGFQLLRYRLKH
jgi:dihydrofolate reductase